MAKKIVAIDPGPERSAIVAWDGRSINMADIVANDQLISNIDEIGGGWHGNHLVIEWIESYGMAVGREVFQTCRWCGKIEQEWLNTWEGNQVHFLTRKQVKSHLCHSTRANDSNVRQALIDRFGPPGTKKAPGLTYGLKKDMWSAFALAVTWLENLNERGMK